MVKDKCGKVSNTSDYCREGNSSKEHGSEQGMLADNGDWYLCEGLLSVFLNANDTKQTIVFKKQKTSTNALSRSSGTGASTH